LLWVWAVWTGAESWIVPFEKPTVIAPNPLKDNDLASKVVDEFWVVFPSATKLSVWLVWTGVVYDPVMTLPFSPNASPLELLRVKAVKLLDVVPALILMLPAPPAAALAVITDPFNPNETPLLLLKTTDPKLPLVVPALKLIGEGAPGGTETTMEPLLNPTDAMPAPWNVKDLASKVVELFWVEFEVAKSPRDWLVWLKEALAVITDPLKPKEILLLFWNVRALTLLLVVPPETLMAEIRPTVEGTV
jgi:hypothetical protein